MGDTKQFGADVPTRSPSEVDLLEVTDPPAQVDPYVGKVIDGRYQVDGVLGQGGMGIVYRGKHKLIDKRVAIKVLRGEMARDKEVTDRFLQEARAASAIGNPHIIDISDFGVLPDGATYFIMEYLDGKPLSTVMEEARPLPVSRILHIAKQIAQGLSAAHAAGIVHRDLKPDNVMLIARGQEKDFVKILDFGIAKVSGETAKLTKAGSVFGTPHYMSPEQAAGAAVNHKTDIYSLGVMLYEMAAGKVPFDAENFMGILTMHMYKAPVPMRALVPAPQEIPSGLDAVVLKCLSKKVDQRYESMDALVEDLERLEKGTMPEAVAEMMARSGGFNVPADYFRSSIMPPAVPGSPQRRSRRTRWPLVAGAAGVLTAIGIVVAIFARSSASEADARRDPADKASAAVTTTPVASSAPAPPPSATAPVAAPTHAIAVAVQPPDAKVTRDGEVLHNPVVLSLADGESATLLVARGGYVSQTVTVASTDASRFVKLVPVPSVHKSGGSHVKQGGGHAGGIGDGLGPDPFLNRR